MKTRAVRLPPLEPPGRAKGGHIATAAAELEFTVKTYTVFYVR
jgi:hypothetical protein